MYNPEAMWEHVVHVMCTQLNISEELASSTCQAFATRGRASAHPLAATVIHHQKVDPIPSEVSPDETSTSIAQQ